jgi:hypothetical protein
MSVADPVKAAEVARVGLSPPPHEPSARHRAGFAGHRYVRQIRISSFSPSTPTWPEVKTPAETTPAAEDLKGLPAPLLAAQATMPRQAQATFAKDLGPSGRPAS